MKLYARRGFEWAEDGLAGLWSPVLTGGTQGMLLDCNPSTNNHGTLTGYTDVNTGWQGSRFGTVRNYDGTSGFDDLGLIPTFNITSLSICGWFFFNAIPPLGQHACLLEKANSSATYAGISFVWNIGNGQGLRFGISGPNQAVFSGSSAVTTGRWIFCAAVWSGGAGIHYVDGTEVARGVINSTAMGTGVPFRTRIGRSDATEAPNVTLNGQIAEMQWFLNRGLRASEILQAYQAGPGGMWQDRPRRSRVYFGAAGFKAYWHRRQSQLIGGGV